MSANVFSPDSPKHEVAGALAARRFYNLRFNLDGRGIRESANLLYRHWTAQGNTAKSEFAQGFLDAAYTISLQRDRVLSTEVTS